MGTKSIGRTRTIDPHKIAEMRAKGMSTKEIADMLECSMNSVQRITNELLSGGVLEGNYADGFHVPNVEIEVPITEGDAADCAANIDPEDYIAEKHLQIDEEPDMANDVRIAPPELVSPDAEPAKRGKTVAEYLAEEEDAEAKRKAAVAEEIHPRFAKKPPLGVMPRWLFWESRRDDLRRAICEFACEGLAIDPEWVAEYNELVVREERNLCKVM